MYCFVGFSLHGFRIYKSCTSTAVFVRFDTNGVDGTAGANNNFNAPFDGRLKKIVFRSEAAAGSTTFSFHKNGPGNGSLNPTATASVTQTALANTSLHVEFPSSAVFDDSEIIGLKFDPTNSPGNVTITCVWEFDNYLD